MPTAFTMLKRRAMPKLLTMLNRRKMPKRPFWLRSSPCKVRASQDDKQFIFHQATSADSME
jgi:hypothetical protein